MVDVYLQCNFLGKRSLISNLRPITSICVKSISIHDLSATPFPFLIIDHFIIIASLRSRSLGPNYEYLNDFLQVSFMFDFVRCNPLCNL